jgi:tetratricopeptide (TPR) repeat protein
MAIVFTIFALPRPDASAAFTRGKALLARGDAAAASAELEKAVAGRPDVADYHIWLARSYVAEAKQTSNAVRLLVLGWKIGPELETALQLDPSRNDARLDLVRYYTLAPRVVGGSPRKAREEAGEIAKRDAALGAYARGYVAYRSKEYGPARIAFEEAAKSDVTSTKVLALMWLGYLSQETQQYDAAFDAFEKVLAADPTHIAAWYEIGRTAVFAHRDFDRGEAALKHYLTTKPGAYDPTLADAREQLRKISEERAASRE